MDIISIRSLRLTRRDRRAARKPETTQATAGVSVYDDTLARNLNTHQNEWRSAACHILTETEAAKCVYRLT